jgi:hypothetical protein
MTSQKVHDPVTMDRFKMICPKWLRGFFYACPKLGLFKPKVVVKKLGIIVVCQKHHLFLSYIFHPFFNMLQP